MNALAGWGFATQEAFERHCNPAPAKPDRRPSFATGRYVKPGELEAYAASLDHIPSHAEVWEYFKCARPSAYNYRTKVIAIMAKRGWIT